MVDPPPPESSPSAPAASSLPSQSSPVPVARTSETVVDRRPVQRAMAQVRTMQPRTHPPVESRVVSRDAPTERTPAVERAAAVIQSAGEIRHARAFAQERTQTSVETTEASVRAVAVPVSTPPTVSSSPAVSSREGLPDDQRAKAEVQDKGSIKTTDASIRHGEPVQDVRAAVESVQVQQVDTKRSEPVVAEVQSVGPVRPHYGWLKTDVMAQIERMKRYPQFALDNRWEGRVVVRAVIRADGHLLELAVVESSGHELLDRESLELLRRLSPVPLKHQLGAPQVTLRIPISYGIR